MFTSAPLVFGKYAVSHRLAVGGMGEVFYATHGESAVVLKTLLPALAQQEGFIDDFLGEARLAARLDHPNVVRLAEVGQWNGTYVIAMEYIHGLNGTELLERCAKLKVALPFAVIAKLIADAALGLGHAHDLKDEQGRSLHVVHRDISPHNLMVRDDGVTKVVDFGIARAADRASRTATGTLKGKLSYMAPEQVLGETLTDKTDQFALGLVAWELLTGERPYQASTQTAMLRQVMEAQVERPSLKRADTPPWLEAIVLKMVSKAPSARFAHCSDVARALAQHLPSNAPAQVAELVRVVAGHDLSLRRQAPSTNPLGAPVVPKAAAMETQVSVRAAAPVAPRVLPEGTVHQPMVQAFVEQVLVRRGLLTEALSTQLRAASLDPAMPRALSYAQWFEVLRLTARAGDEKRALDEGFDDLGRELFRGTSTTWSWRFCSLWVRVVGLRRGLRSLLKRFERSDSVTRVSVHETSETQVRLTFADTGGLIGFWRGQLHEALLALGAKELQVTPVADAPDSIDVRWS